MKRFLISQPIGNDNYKLDELLSELKKFERRRRIIKDKKGEIKTEIMKSIYVGPLSNHYQGYLRLTVAYYGLHSMSNCGEVDEVDVTIDGDNLVIKVDRGLYLDILLSKKHILQEVFFRDKAT